MQVISVIFKNSRKKSTCNFQNVRKLLTLNFNNDIVKLGDQRTKRIKKFREDLWKHVLKYEFVVNEKQDEVDKLMIDLEV